MQTPLNDTQKTKECVLKTRDDITRAEVRGSPLLLQFIHRRTLMCAPNFKASHPKDYDIVVVEVVTFHSKQQILTSWWQ